MAESSDVDADGGKYSGLPGMGSEGELDALISLADVAQCVRSHIYTVSGKKRPPPPNMSK